MTPVVTVEKLEIHDVDSVVDELLRLLQFAKARRIRSKRYSGTRFKFFINFERVLGDGEFVTCCVKKGAIPHLLIGTAEELLKAHLRVRWRVLDFSVFFVSHFLEPIDATSIYRLLNRKMSHGGIGCCSVPVLNGRRSPNDISFFNSLNGFSPFLNESFARGHNEKLALRMKMPCRTGTFFEGH